MSSEQQLTRDDQALREAVDDQVRYASALDDTGSNSMAQWTRRCAMPAHMGPLQAEPLYDEVATDLCIAMDYAQ